MKVSRYLAVNEQAVTNVRLHWVVLARVILETVAGLVAVLAIAIYSATHGGGGKVLVTLLWWMALAAVVRLAWRVLDWDRTRLLITTSRLVRVSGIISTKVQSIPMSKITDLSYTMDPNGRLLGYGAFVLETEGDHKSDLEKLAHIPRPDRFYLLFCDSIFGSSPEPATDEF
ncbi:PH domain-containing protein [Frankia sp. AgKG'84/4]|uniref:PH domain-containing protein n=1 Tax=Frankia sp. AgKG'84/4 TaxID=573490 RepID=UPI00200CA4FE|nr:PH domain-containing protein [Frankia sp. AgKG'84/4]MCL9797322.1 PH domain-containing protein [Frankia sp. AgKG'84/4]